MQPILVDSCYYIDLSRRGIDPLSHLTAASAVLERDLVTCGIVRCEVGRGIKTPRVLAAFQAFWDVMLYVPTDNFVWEETERLAWELGRKGHQPPLQDIVIANCAKKIGAAVLTLDRHFELVPGLAVMRTLV